MLEIIKNLLFPARCPLCDRASCVSCLPEREGLDNARCPLCGASGCHCKGPWCDGFFVLFPYDEQVRASIARMKYRGRPSYAVGYAKALARALAEREHPPFDLVVHVPFYRAEKRNRDYNASRLLADNLAREIGVPHCKRALRKLRPTEKQHELSAAQRRVNLAGCFAASHKVAGKRVLLCDDVVTTGSTLNECARALKQAGANSVWAAAVAATPRVRWKLN